MDRKETKNEKPRGMMLPPLKAVDTGDVCAIVDTDPRFFTLIDGRPIRPNKSLLKYKQDIKNITLNRTMYGFLADEISRISRNIETERRQYEMASKHFDECQYSFDKFLAHDNDQTIEVMRKSDCLAKELARQLDEHKAASYEHAALRAKLQYLGETLQILASFQRFLRYAAPLTWRESGASGEPAAEAGVPSLDSNIFAPIDVKAAEVALRGQTELSLYFETPQELLDAFGALEKQNLNSLLVTEELNAEKKQFLMSVKRLKKLMDLELDLVQQKIKQIEEFIRWNVSREVKIKVLFYKVLDKDIKYLVSSKTALQIGNYVEFAFEKTIAPNETKLSTLEMMHCLEREFNDIMLDLTAFDLHEIKAVEKEIYKEGVSEIRKARSANKWLNNVDNLNRRMKSAYEPSKKPTVN